MTFTLGAVDIFLGPTRLGAYQVPGPARPRYPIAITRFYIPGAVGVQGVTEQPTVAHLFLGLTDGGNALWADSSDVDLLAGAGLYSNGNFLVVDDLTNPILISKSDSPLLQARVSFDQDATDDGWIFVGAQPPSPGVSVKAIATPGAIVWQAVDQ